MRAALLAAAAAALAAAQTERVELSLNIPAQREECFHIDARAGDMLEAGVLVFRGGKLDVKLRVTGPDGRVAYEKLLLSNIDDATGRMLPTIVEKGHKWGAPTDGTYAMCLDNRCVCLLSWRGKGAPRASGLPTHPPPPPPPFSPSPPPRRSMARWTDKAVTLRVTRRDPRDGRGDYGLDPNAATPSEGMRLVAQRMHAKLEQIRTLQSYHFHRERRHRDTVESTNARVQWWGLAENVVIGCVTTFMVVLVKTWFKRAGGLLPGGGKL